MAQKLLQRGILLTERNCPHRVPTEDLGGAMGWAAQPPDGMWVAPVPWRLGSWVCHRRTGHWGYVFRSERNMCYLYFPVPIEQVPEWLRMEAIRLDLCRGDERPMTWHANAHTRTT